MDISRIVMESMIVALLQETRNKTAWHVQEASYKEPLNVILKELKYSKLILNLINIKFIVLCWSSEQGYIENLVLKLSDMNYCQVLLM